MAKDNQLNTKNIGLNILNIKNIRLTRNIALEIGLLAIIIIVAILFRVIPYRYGAYLTAFDPLFQFRATEYIVENGYSSWGEWHDLQSWYPLGRDVPSSAYPGVPFTAAFVYHLVHTIGMNLSVHDVSLFFPIFMAVLTCISAYYLGKEINGSATGVFAALFLAINPPFIGRTSMGFFDTENIGIFCIVIISLFFLRSIDEGKSVEHRVIYQILSGLFLGYIYASWGAARYMTGLLALYMLFLIITCRYNFRHLVSFNFTIGLGFFIIIFVPRLGAQTLLKLDSLVAIGLVVFLLGVELFKKKINLKILSNFMAVILVFSVVGIFLVPVIGIDIPITYKFLRVLNPFSSAGNFLYQSIAENHVVGWASFFNDFGIILPFSLIGSYFITKEYNEKTLYLVLFFVTSLYFAGVMSRLSQILAAPTCILAAYGLVQFMKPFVGLITPEDSSKRRRRQLAVFGVNKPISILFILLIGVSFIPNIANGLVVGDTPTSLASSSVSIKINGEYPNDWPEALNWIGKNVDDDEVICSWWDYGYWITSMTGKTTMADGATQSQNQISNIGKIMMLPPNQSLPILERYGADYILVFYTANPETGQEWPFGDNAAADIAGLVINDLRVHPLVREVFQRTEEHLSRVVISENGFVKIYKVIY
jgi:dolichyl-diphosphooligosaccharide--protein glycosyltransferase